MARAVPSARSPAGAPHRWQGRAPRRLTWQIKEIEYPNVQRVSVALAGMLGTVCPCIGNSGGSPRCESPPEPSRIVSSDRELDQELLLEGGTGHEKDSHALLAGRSSRRSSGGCDRQQLGCFTQDRQRHG